MSASIETDVLIVGTGPAGGSAAVMLSTYGIANVVVTKYGWTANTPRAHITNQRALEIMRDLSLQEQCERDGTPNELMGDTVFATSLAGDELARLHTWGTHPRRLADYTLASPCLHIDLPQTYFEPILVRAAAERGSRLRFNTEFLSFEQDSDGVTATVQDRLSGSTYEIRAKYLLAGDGGRSVIAEQLGLPFGGQANVAGSMNIVFRADLSPLVAHRPSVLYWIMSPGARMGGIGMGLVRMVRPWYEWLIVWGYDIDGPAPDVDEARATEIAHKLIGTDEIPVEIVSTSLWTNNRFGRSATRRAACSAWATPSTATRRSTGWAPTHRSPTPTNRLEARARAAGPRRPLAASHLRRRARAGRRADSQAGEQEHRGVRTDLRGARPARRDRRSRADGAQHGGPHEGHPGGEGAAREAARRDRAEELRVQRPRCRARPALPLGRRRDRRYAGAAL